MLRKILFTYIIVVVYHIIGVCGQSIEHDIHSISDNLVLRDESKKTQITIEQSTDDNEQLQAQLKLLSKQLNALILRRQEDYESLERSLKKYVAKTTIQYSDMELRAEFDEMKKQMKTLQAGSTSKERLTTEWMAESIAELRAELGEIHQVISNTSKQLQQLNEEKSSIRHMKKELEQTKLELESLRVRQDKNEIAIMDLRNEALNNERLTEQLHAFNEKDGTIRPIMIPNDADHKQRHQRFQRQQHHDIELQLRHLEHQVKQIHHHRLAERIQQVELEQEQLKQTTSNITHEILDLDKLHGSMLELLESVEETQSKIDNTMPDIKREIAKYEFKTAELASQNSALRDDERNMAKTVQAIALSVSLLQENRNTTCGPLQQRMNTLETDVKQLKEVYNRHQFTPLDYGTVVLSNNQPINKMKIDAIQTTELIKNLENVEKEFEMIVNKLPHECSEIIMKPTNQNALKDKRNELNLIAPLGQHNPVMVPCNGEWTTIQRRFDGSVDFNRSWDSYAMGFGTPDSEYWIGNELIHRLTSNGGPNCTQLKIIINDIYDNIWEANYNQFYVASRTDGYRISISGHSGNASDALSYQNNMKFSAIDVDNDISNTHCASNYEGGWWFSHCQHANLNGRYNLGLTWFDATRNEWIAVKSSHMMILTRKNCELT